MTDLTKSILAIQDAWAAKEQPHAVMEAAGHAFAAHFGYRLYTVTRTLPGEQEVERIYSTNLDVYPLTGRKPIVQNAYTQRVRRDLKPFLGRTFAEFQEFFADRNTIAELGLGSIMNLPVLFNGRAMGTVNLLDVENAYGPAQLDDAMLVARQILPAFLEQRS